MTITRGRAAEAAKAAAAVQEKKDAVTKILTEEMGFTPEQIKDLETDINGIPIIPRSPTRAGPVTSPAAGPSPKSNIGFYIPDKVPSKGLHPQTLVAFEYNADKISRDLQFGSIRYWKGVAASRPKWTEKQVDTLWNSYKNLRF